MEPEVEPRPRQTADVARDARGALLAALRSGKLQHAVAELNGATKQLPGEQGSSAKKKASTGISGPRSEFSSLNKLEHKLAERDYLLNGTSGVEQVTVMAGPVKITTMGPKRNVPGTLFLSTYRLGFLCDDWALHSVPLLTIRKLKCGSVHGAPGRLSIDGGIPPSKIKILKVSSTCN